MKCETCAYWCECELYDPNTDTDVSMGYGICTLGHPGKRACADHTELTEEQEFND